MKYTTLPLLMSAALGTFSSQAAELEISFHNLTQGIYFTPVLIASHNSDTHLFEVGTAASAALQAMAEGGDISGLVTAVEAASGATLQNPAEGLMAPGASVTGQMLDTGDNTHLSLTAMLLPTNDGFVGLDSWEIPTTAGTYVISLNGYDAGTEANNELVVDGSGAPGTPGIPAAPGADAGAGGTGVEAAEANNMVHIHPGNLGDFDAAGGTSDLVPNVHRWLNPVARLVVTVK